MTIDAPAAASANSAASGPFRLVSDARRCATSPSSGKALREDQPFVDGDTQSRRWRRKESDRLRDCRGAADTRRMPKGTMRLVVRRLNRPGTALGKVGGRILHPNRCRHAVRRMAKMKMAARDGDLKNKSQKNERNDSSRSTAAAQNAPQPLKPRLHPFTLHAPVCTLQLQTPHRPANVPVNAAENQAFSLSRSVINNPI